MVTNLPPATAEKETVFVHDYFNSFTSTMFIGNELRLFAFEALFFCVIDTSLQNVSDKIGLIFLVWNECTELYIFASTAWAGNKYCLDNVRRFHIPTLDPATHGRKQFVSQDNDWPALLDLEIIDPSGFLIYLYCIPVLHIRSKWRSLTRSWFLFCFLTASLTNWTDQITAGNHKENHLTFVIIRTEDKVSRLY